MLKLLSRSVDVSSLMVDELSSSCDEELLLLRFRFPEMKKKHGLDFTHSRRCWQAFSVLVSGRFHESFFNNGHQ